MREMRARWLPVCVVLGVLALVASSSGCGSSGGNPQTGIQVHNGTVADDGFPNPWTIIDVTIGSDVTDVSIAPGQTVFLPVPPGDYDVEVHYNDSGNTVEIGQDPPDPVQVRQDEVTFIHFFY